MIADRVLDDVGLNPYLTLRMFLSRCFTPCAHWKRGIAVAESLDVNALLTIMRNRVTCLSTMHGAISGVSASELRMVRHL